MDKYFANQDAETTAAELLKKAHEWDNTIETSGYGEKLRNLYTAYYGMFNDSEGHQITFSGEQGELVNLPVNQIKNIGEHMLNMTTANRPSMEARAINTDYKSLIQTTLANGILEYYMREKRLEKYLKNAVELAISQAAGYVRIAWNSSLGEVVDFIEETQTEIREGDLEFSNLSWRDVRFDTTREDVKNDWVAIRTWKNRFDVAAKYPEIAEKILQLPTKSDLEKQNIHVSMISENTDDIPMYEFFHLRTESMPEGRYLSFLDEDLILDDLPMPYRVLPIFRISPSMILGTQFGYTPLFDIYPIQQAMNSLYSTILTNQSTFGVQNIWVEPGTNLNVSSVYGGLNVIESLKKPESIQLTNTPKEIFEFLNILERTAETISGVSSVTRGNTEGLGSNPSGTALALIQSMSLQFMSGLQQSYVQLIEDVGTAIIKLLQDFASTPRLIAIAGRNNRTYMKSFSSKDISNISRVVVDVGNPLARTTAGRVQMADQLLQYQMIKNPNQYVTLINTGRLDAITDDMQHEMFLIKGENEDLVDGKQVVAMVTDDHMQHIMEHKSVLSDPELRRNPELVKRVNVHLLEHINILRTTDPAFLQAMGQQPLPPIGASAEPQVQSGGPAPSAVDSTMEETLQPPSEGQEMVQPNPDGTMMVGPGIEGGARIPNPAQPPEIPQI